MWLLRNCSKTLSMKNVSFMRHTLNGHLGDAVQITGIVGPRKFSFTSQLNKAMRDYYAVLQVSRSALQKDIKEAYDLLSKRYVRELERDNDSKEATEKLLSITEAYEVLGNIGRRRMYDKGLIATSPRVPHTVSDVFEKLETLDHQHYSGKKVPERPVNVIMAQIVPPEENVFDKTTSQLVTVAFVIIVSIYILIQVENYFGDNEMKKTASNNKTTKDAVDFNLEES